MSYYSAMRRNQHWDDGFRPGQPRGPYGWVDNQTNRPVTPAATPAANQTSPALSALYRGRAYVRGLYENFGNDALAENARETGRNMAAVDTSTAKRGLYSTTVRDALRNRAQESGARSRGYLQEQIDKTKADMETGFTGQISDLLSHEEDRRQGYAQAIAQGNAQRRAQNRSDLFGFAGAIGGGLLGFL